MRGDLVKSQAEFELSIRMLFSLSQAKVMESPIG